MLPNCRHEALYNGKGLVRDQQLLGYQDESCEEKGEGEENRIEERQTAETEPALKKIVLCWVIQVVVEGIERHQGNLEMRQ